MDQVAKARLNLEDLGPGIQMNTDRPQDRKKLSNYSSSGEDAGFIHHYRPLKMTSSSNQYGAKKISGEAS